MRSSTIGNHSRDWFIGLFLISLLAISGGCASSGPVAYPVPPSDPLEGLNRAMFKFNTVFDKGLARPIAKGYDFIMPEPAQKGVTNFFRNLNSPISIVNNLLQGKFYGAFTETSRLVINSVLGIGGIFDPATDAGIERKQEGFGNTFAVWGIKPGPYLVVPFIGPTSFRDGVGLIAAYYTTPLTYYNNTSVRDKLWILGFISLRTSLLSVDKQFYGAADPYVWLRNSWVQNRNYEIFDGDPPEIDSNDDDFGGEFKD